MESFASTSASASTSSTSVSSPRKRGPVPADEMDTEMPPAQRPRVEGPEGEEEKVTFKRLGRPSSSAALAAVPSAADYDADLFSFSEHEYKVSFKDPKSGQQKNLTKKEYHILHDGKPVDFALPRMSTPFKLKADYGSVSMIWGTNGTERSQRLLSEAEELFAKVTAAFRHQIWLNRAEWLGDDAVVVEEGPNTPAMHLFFRSVVQGPTSKWEKENKPTLRKIPLTFDGNSVLYFQGLDDAPGGLEAQPNTRLLCEHNFQAMFIVRLVGFKPNTTGNGQRFVPILKILLCKAWQMRSQFEAPPYLLPSLGGEEEEPVPAE